MPSNEVLSSGHDDDQYEHNNEQYDLNNDKHHPAYGWTLAPDRFVAAHVPLGAR